MSVSSTPIHANMAVHLDKVSSCVPVLSFITGVIDLIAKAALLKSSSSPNNEYLNYLAGKSWKACAIQCLPIAGNVYALVSLLMEEGVGRSETTTSLKDPTPISEDPTPPVMEEGVGRSETTTSLSDSTPISEDPTPPAVFPRGLLAPVRRDPPSPPPVEGFPPSEHIVTPSDAVHSPATGQPFATRLPPFPPPFPPPAYGSLERSVPPQNLFLSDLSEVFYEEAKDFPRSSRESLYIAPLNEIFYEEAIDFPSTSHQNLHLAVAEDMFSSLDVLVPPSNEGSLTSLFFSESSSSGAQASLLTSTTGQNEAQAPEAQAPEAQAPEAQDSILKARDSVFERLPRKTIKEKTLASAFNFIRKQIGVPGAWYESGETRVKEKNLAKIKRKISPKVPNFKNVREATDMAKVLIGTVSDRKVTPLLEHTLSFSQFCLLSKKAEKKRLTVAETDAVLKEAFGNDRNKLLTFKALLILLKETSEVLSKEANENPHTNEMVAESRVAQAYARQKILDSLISCPLNPLLQRHITNPSNKVSDSKKLLLGAFLISKAEDLLADI